MTLAQFAEIIAMVVLLPLLLPKLCMHTTIYAS